MNAFKGYKTVFAMSLALACALYQQFVGPLPEVNQGLWNVLVPAVALGLRFVTDSPVGGKKE